MKLTDLFFIAVGLSMDSFAVSISQGIKFNKLNLKNMFLIAVTFAVCQGGMPYLGYLLGSTFERLIVTYDHWIAFILLLIIGGKMIYDGMEKEEVKNEISNENITKNRNKKEIINDKNRLKMKEIILLGIATSIDALALGITFPLLKVNIVYAVLIISLVTFIASNLGIFIGNKFGGKLKDKSEMLGGIILVAIGTKILLEHLNLF